METLNNIDNKKKLRGLKLSFFLFCIIYLFIFTAAIGYAVSDEVKILERLKNYNISSISNVLNDCLRALGFGVVKFFGTITDSLFNGLRQVFNTLTFSYSDEIMGLVDRYSVLYKAVLIVSITFVGLYFLIGKRGKETNVVMCVLIMVLIISAMPLMMQKIGSLTLTSTEVAMSSWSSDSNGQRVKSITGDVVKDNIVDLRKVDTNMTDSSLPKGLQKDKGYNNFTANTWKSIDINDRMDYESSDYGLKHNNVWEVKLVPDSDQNDSYTTEKMDGWFEFTTNYYYRYQVLSWFGMIVKLGCMVVLLFLLIIRAARIVIDLAMAMIYTPFVAVTDLTTGQRIKEVIKDIIAHFAALFLIAALMGVYFVGFTWINNLDIGTIPKLGMHIALIWAIIDGPSIIERITGVDVGFGGVWKTVLAAKGAADIGAHVARASKKTAGAAASTGGKAGKGLASFVFGKKAVNSAADRMKNAPSDMAEKATGGRGAVGAVSNLKNHVSGNASASATSNHPDAAAAESNIDNSSVQTRKSLDPTPDRAGSENLNTGARANSPYAEGNTQRRMRGNTNAGNIKNAKRGLKGVKRK